MFQIEAIESDHGTINILKSRSTGALIYEVEGCHQSSADSKGVSLASYIHAIFGLLVQAKARNILIIGGGGGTLATMLARGQRDATIVDVDPASFVVARRYFGLPESTICHAADGEVFLRDDTNAYDAIVLDAFHGYSIPPHLQSPQFFALVRERLTPDGAVFANVHVKHDFDDSADRVAGNMKSVWPDVRVLDAEGICERSAIVMAGRIAPLREPALLVRPEANAGLIAGELARLQFRGWKASRWSFGG